MSFKIICPQVFSSFIKILHACRELNQIAKFTTIESGFLIESMDTFNQTELSCTLKAQQKQNKIQYSTYINLELISPLIALLRERKRPILIKFQENSNILFKDPNLDQIDLCPPLEYLCDIAKNYLPRDVTQQSYFISLLVSDLFQILLGLCVGDGVANITLDSKGILIFKNKFEVGDIHISKQLKKNNINDYGPVNINVTIKFIKVLILVATSKKCTLELPKNQDGYLKIHFNICSEASGYFALIPF